MNAADGITISILIHKLNKLNFTTALIQPLDNIANSYNKGVCCFGELLLRFSPALNGKFIAQSSMPVYIGGAELNVATALANWGLTVKYVTVLPDNYLSKEIVSSIAQKGIDTNAIKYIGERIGSYYLPQGADLKNSGVIYDRGHSSFATLQPGVLDWDTILEGVGWFHFSAISPALNETVAAVCLEALKVAAKKNITISTDLNYRAKLWQYGKKPLEVMPALVKFCHVIMGNIWSAETLLGVTLPPDFTAHHNDKNSFLEQSARTAKMLRGLAPDCHTIANTFRFDEGEGIRYFAALHNQAGNFASSTYTTKNILDKVGSGDCFMAGLIYGATEKLSSPDTVEFAAAAAFGKLQQMGDATTSTINDVQETIKTHAQATANNTGIE